MISIPQMVSGVVTLFVAIIGIVVFNPLLQMILGLVWDDSQLMTKYALTIGIYLVYVFVVYVIVYGSLQGRLPPMIERMEGITRQEETYSQ